MLPRTLIQPVVEGQRHNIEANIGGALHVVMAAEDIGAHAGAANVAGEQEQHAARPHVRGADRVLGLAHAPDQCRRLVLREHLGDTFELFAGNTGNAFNFFRSPLFHFLARIFIAVNTLPDEILVLPAVLDDVPHDPVQHRDIGSGAQTHAREEEQPDGTTVKVSLLADGSYPKGSEIKDGYPEFTLAVLKKLGWDKDLTEAEMAVINKINPTTPDTVSWSTDLSGGIQRVALIHGCVPYGNAKARM